jgi:multidrug efflux system membrane fusion protein
MKPLVQTWAKKYVLVVKDDGSIDYRTVELGPKLEGLRIIRTGLNKDDKVIVNGLQRVRPGMQVDPQVVPMADPATLAELKRQRDLVADNLSESGKPLQLIANDQHR